MIANPARLRDNHISALLITGDFACHAYICTHISQKNLHVCGPASVNRDRPHHQRFDLFIRQIVNILKGSIY